MDACLFAFLETWPTAHHVVAANVDEISNLIKPLGFRHRRAGGIIRFSKEYLNLLECKRQCRSEQLERGTDDQIEIGYQEDAKSTTRTAVEAQFTRDEIMGLYQCGQYAYDAYVLFAQRNATNDPTDAALCAYTEYKRALSEEGDN